MSSGAVSAYGCKTWYLVNPRQHNCLVHPCGILTVVVMGCGERCELLLRNAAICLPLNSLTAIGGRDRQFFYELLCSLVTSTIFVRC